MRGDKRGECGASANSQTAPECKYLPSSQPLKKGFSIPCWAVVPIKEFEQIKQHSEDQGITFSQWMYAAVAEKLNREK